MLYEGEDRIVRSLHQGQDRPLDFCPLTQATPDGRKGIVVTTSDLLDPVVSSTQLAAMTGTDLRWVQRQTRRLGLQPVYVVGERQWSRLDALKLCLLARLQGVLGESSSLPFEIVADAESSLERLLSAPDQGTVLALRSTGVSFVVGVPGLAHLVGAA